MSASKTYWLTAGFALLAITVIHIVTLRAGMDWDGDWALYVQQAMNLVDGRGFSQTYFIPNPDNPIAPTVYPPGLPFVLAPVYWAFGLSYQAMKYEGVLVFVLYLAVYLRLAQRILPRGLAIAAMCLIGVNPFFWALKNGIYSEFLFLLLAYASLLLADRASEANKAPLPHKIAWYGALAAAVVGACLTRSIGVVLFPAILGAAVLRERRVPWAALISMIVAGGAFVSVSLRLASDSGTYLGYFHKLSLRSMHLGVLDYLAAGGAFFGFDASPWPAVSPALTLMLGALACWGLLQRLLHAGPEATQLFTIGYATSLIVYPSFDPRYGAPLWPLVLLFSLHGATLLLPRVRDAAVSVRAGAVLAGTIGLLFAAADASMEYGPVPNSITDPRAQQLFAAIEEFVPRDGVVLSRKPTIIGLHGQRKASIWPRHFDDDEAFWSHARRTGATFLVQDVHHFADGDYNPDDSLDAFVSRNTDQLTLLFRNEWFSLYHFEPPLAREPTTSSQNSTPKSTGTRDKR